MIRSHARALLAAAALLALAPAGASPAVLIELFTAQGCSTCPPADKLLSALGADPDLGKELVPLAFHVTYWDTKDWRDRFSDKAWTQRQQDYLTAIGKGDLYTPQAVVAGGYRCIGSNVTCIHEGVEVAKKKPQGTVTLTPTSTSGDKVELTVEAQPPAGGAALDVMVAVYESGLDTDVKGGENAHKTLHDDYVVRRLERAFTVSGDGAKQQTVKLKLDRDWVRANLGVAAFLQDPKTREVYGAAAIKLPAS